MGVTLEQVERILPSYQKEDQGEGLYRFSRGLTGINALRNVYVLVETDRKGKVYTMHCLASGRTGFLSFREQRRIRKEMISWGPIKVAECDVYDDIKKVPHAAIQHIKEDIEGNK